MDDKVIKDLCKLLGGMPIKVETGWTPVGRELIILHLNNDMKVSLITHSKEKIKIKND